MKKRLAMAAIALSLVVAPYGATALQVNAAATGNNTVTATDNNSAKGDEETKPGTGNGETKPGTGNEEAKPDKPETKPIIKVEAVETETPAQAGIRKLEENFAYNIEKAAPGSTVVIEKESGITTLSAGMLNSLVQNPTISLHMEYTYDGKDYSITIPAGGFELQEGIWWYGPLWLAAHYAD